MDYRKIEKIVHEELHLAELRILARLKNDNLLTSDDNLFIASPAQIIQIPAPTQPKKPLPDNETIIC